MAILDAIIGPIAGLLDKLIPDPKARETKQAEAARAPRQPGDGGGPHTDSAIMAEAQSADPWTSRARPSFLYVMYTLLLWAIPMGLIAAVQPQMAKDIAAGMNAYLGGIPEPLYALFGTGYLGYTVARQWGKAKGIDK